MLLIITITVFLFFTLLVYKLISFKTQLRFEINHSNLLLQQYNEAQSELKNLINDKIKLLQQVEKLSTELSYQKNLHTDLVKNREEIFNVTKASLFELGNSLSNQLVELHKKESKEAQELSAKNISMTTEKLHTEFEKLVQMIGALHNNIEHSRSTVDIIKSSLLSPSSAGHLAEITLENILKNSGLRKDIDFIMQYSIHVDNNSGTSKLRPDALIFLPNDHLIVVDAKTSKFLVDSGVKEGEENDLSLQNTMRNHLKLLSTKEYATHILTDLKKKYPDRKFNNIITLMFLPTEQAVEKIIASDKNFWDKALTVNIFPVGPAGLSNMLSLAKFHISEDLRIHNYQLIIDEVKKILHSITAMSEHAQRLATGIQSVVNNYDKFAASFNRNFLSRSKNIQKLGVSSGSKNPPLTLERYHLSTTIQSDIIDVETDEQQIALEIDKQSKKLSVSHTEIVNNDEVVEEA